MRKHLPLIAATLVLTSCSPSVIGIDPPSRMRPKTVSSEQTSEVLDRLREIQTLQRKSGFEIKAKFNYKGIPHHRHIDNFSEEELVRASQNELTLVASHPKQLDLDKTLAKLTQMGYSPRVLGDDAIVVSFPERGVGALKKHFKVLDKLTEFKVIAPRFFVQIQSVTPYSPNDFSSTTQWGLSKINAPAAWGYHQIRNANIVAAVVDTGVNASHEDLVGKLEPGLNSQPTYKTSSWSAWYGWNSDTTDYNGHGTGVAGILGAATDNGKGLSGTGFSVRIMPMKASVESPADSIKLSTDHVRAAITKAIDNGARIINCSFGGYVDDYFLASAVQYAQDRDIPVICATGNEADEPSFQGICWPARYPNPNVIAVGATDESHKRAGFSNYGPEIELCAPGWKIGAPDSPSIDSYAEWTGTSQAAPFVTGVFASLMGACSALPYTLIRDVLFATATKPENYRYESNVWNGEIGFGILNFGAAADFLLGSGLVFQWYDPSSNIRDWTSNATEKPLANFDKIAFALSPTEAPGTVRLYRKYHAPSNDHFLTTDINEASSYDNKGELGYIATVPGAGGMYSPLFRLWKSGQNHMYSADPNEIWSLVQSGWHKEKLEGYVNANRKDSLLTGMTTSIGPSTSGWKFDLVDWNNDGVLDLAGVKLRATSSGKIEVHLADGKTRFDHSILDKPTAEPVTDQDWDFKFADWNRDGRADLVLIKKTMTGTGRTEVHVFDGNTEFQSFLYQGGTLLPPTDSTFEFHCLDWNKDGAMDVVYLKKSASGPGTSNSTEVHVLDGSLDSQGKRYQRHILETGTALYPTDSTWHFGFYDWNNDGILDLGGIATAMNTGTGCTEAHVLNGSTRFDHFLLQSGLPLTSGIPNCEYFLTDWNKDGSPELFVVKKDSDATRVIVSQLGP